MTLNHTGDKSMAAATDAVLVWNLPWQARLKNLAEAQHLCFAQGPRRPAGTVQTWLERVRITS